MHAYVHSLADVLAWQIIPPFNVYKLGLVAMPSLWCYYSVFTDIFALIAHVNARSALFA